LEVTIIVIMQNTWKSL